MLSDMEKRFADEYMVDMSALKAAKRAGYLESTARGATRWLNPESKRFKPELKQYIDQRLKKTEREKIADAEEIMEFLTAVMRCDKNNAQNADKSGAGIRERLKSAELLWKRYSSLNDRAGDGGDLPVIISGGDELDE